MNAPVKASPAPVVSTTEVGGTGISRRSPSASKQKCRLLATCDHRPGAVRKRLITYTEKGRFGFVGNNNLGSNCVDQLEELGSTVVVQQRQRSGGDRPPKGALNCRAHDPMTGFRKLTRFERIAGHVQPVDRIEQIVGCHELGGCAPLSEERTLAGLIDDRDNRPRDPASCDANIDAGGHEFSDQSFASVIVTHLSAEPNLHVRSGSCDSYVRSASPACMRDGCGCIRTSAKFLFDSSDDVGEKITDHT